MLSVFARLLQWARSVGHNWFFHFGLHCATHQIRVILISGVVITSLFYPALALYASSLPKLSSLTDVLSPINAFSTAHAQEDLVNLWANYDSLRTHEGAVARAKCTPGSALRVERILIQSPLEGDDDALNQRILTSTLDLEERLASLMVNSEDACLEKPGGRCFLVSPLAFWDHDRDAVSLDDDILDTLSHTENVTIAGIPVSPQMVLAGLGSDDGHVAPSKFDYAKFLALTYFFPDSQCLGNQEHARWVQMVHKAADHFAVTPQTQEPTLIALDFNRNLQTGSTAISTFLYGAYASFFVYVLWSFGRMSAVHSRLGVTFTALVEITVSTITSLSVCALVGFRITMVPWELLPIVIVFVGAENMFNLVDAVGKTSTSLPVKRRIAEGLSKAGTSNTLKVMASNAVLGVIAFLAVGAVRQFCAFAIVVLTAHWFLAHTFFMAVLSIDIARLELEELLRHDTTLAPSLIQTSSKETTKQSGSKLHRVLKSRAFANSSLVMLLAITATLYYATTESVPHRPQTAKPLGAVARPKATNSNIPPVQMPVAEHIWHVLNPEQRPLLHLKIESPTVLTLNTAGKPRTKEGKLHHRTRRTISSLIWATKIMLLPIGITITLLYSLLLYLLKDTELLETQRHSTTTEITEDEKSLDTQAHFTTLPRAIASDIELVASSKDGKVVVSVGLHNEIVVWNSESGTYLSINAGDVLLTSPSTSDSTSLLTSLAVDDTGSLVAIGTNTGIITVWVLVGGRTTALPVLALNDTSAAVTELHFISTLPTTPSERKLSIPPPSFPVILATYADGTAVRWSVERTPTVTRFTPSRDAAIVKSSLLRVSTDNSVLIAFCLDDGTIDLHETGDYTPVFLNDYCIQPGNALDPVSKLHACRAELNGSTRPIIAAATERGTVTLWDGLTGECIFILDELQGTVNALRILPASNTTCHFCGHPPPESVSVAFSVDHVVRFFSLCINDQLRRCSCSQSQVRRISVKETVGRRSRSSSAASSRIGSPLIPRARLATAFEASDFPVSGHGVHSRRASEKEGRRSFEQVQLTVPFQSENGDSQPINGISTPQLWSNMVMVLSGDVTCERGGWDVTSSKFVGIRRRARSQGVSKGGAATPMSMTSTQGLTKATLDRWEIWTFEPAFSRLRLSKLSDLSLKPTQSPRRISTSSCSGSPPPSPSGDIARLPFTRVSPLSISSSHALAGFGNTVGVFDFSSEF